MSFLAIRAFLTTIPGWITITAVAAVLGSGIWLVRDYSYRGVEIQRLKTEVTTLEGRLAVSEANAELAAQQVDVLSAELAERAGSIEQICQAFIKQKFNRDPASLECIDPTVGEALEDIKRIEEGTRK